MLCIRPVEVFLFVLILFSQIKLMKVYESGIIYCDIDNIIGSEDTFYEYLQFSIANCPKSLYMVIQWKDINHFRSQSFDPISLLSQIYHQATLIFFHYHHHILYPFFILFSPYCEHDPFLLDDIDTLILLPNQDHQSINHRRMSRGLSPLQVIQLKEKSDSFYPYSSSIPSLRSSQQKLNSLFPLSHFKKVILGGTFDHLHVGHLVLLSAAILSSSESVEIGLTDGSYLKNKLYPEEIQSYNMRANAVVKFCNLFRRFTKITTIPLYDSYGPSITDPSFEAIIVSNETKSVVDSINSIRQIRGMSMLKTVVVDLVFGNASFTSTDFEESKKDPNPSSSSNQSVIGDTQVKISSTDIRKFLHDRQNKADDKINLFTK